jgi:hypothetical protein
MRPGLWRRLCSPDIRDAAGVVGRLHPPLELMYNVRQQCDRDAGRDPGAGAAACGLTAAGPPPGRVRQLLRTSANSSASGVTFSTVAVQVRGFRIRRGRRCSDDERGGGGGRSLLRVGGAECARPGAVRWWGRGGRSAGAFAIRSRCSETGQLAVAQRVAQAEAS